LCTIRDFCPGGMLLVGTGGSKSLAATGANAQRGEPIHLHFSVPTPGGDKNFRLAATIARILDGANGIGIRFPEPLGPATYQALMDFAAASGTVAASAADAAAAESGAGEVRDAAGAEVAEQFLRDRRIREGDAEKVREQLRRLMSRAGTRLINGFFERCNRDLLARARDAGTNAVQMMYFEGLDQIEKRQEQIRKRFATGILSQIDQVLELETVLEKRRRRDAGETKKLELVDTEKFEEWLSLAEIITKAENRHADALLDIRARLSLIAKPWGHKDVVPVGPAAITWAFDDAVREIDVRRQVKQDIYKEFEGVLTPLLGNLYQAIGKLLEESGVFPSVEEIRNAMARSLRRPAPPPRARPEAYQSMEASVREAAMAADGIPMAPGPGYNPFEPQGGGSGEVVKAAREMLSLGRRVRRARGAPEEAPIAPPDARPEQRYNTGDILQAISSIERDLGDTPLKDVRLKPRLIEVLKRQHGDQKAFGEEQYDTLDVMENLVDSLEQDHFLTEGIRGWIKRLELTLNKLATRDPEFLEHERDRPHSAVQVLNQLARIGNAQDVRFGIDRDVGHRVDELLSQVVREYDKNPKIFEDILDELGVLADRQAKAYRGNVERTVRASEGQQKLARARRSVVDALAPRITGDDVPDLLLRLLNPGWRNLMVHNYLRHGPGSPEFRDALAVTDQLKAQLNGSIAPGAPDYVPPETLLKRVVAGLNSISFEPGKRTPLVMSLSDALIGDAAGEKAPVARRQVRDAETMQVLGLEGLIPDPKPAIESDDESIRKDWARALERARRLAIGDWLATADEDGRPLILSVAFIGDDYGHFVLVNRKGIKSKELPLKDMADGLHQGRITVLDDVDLPLMERASQRMLQNMHNRLTHQASHDELTDLLNRKEFERAVAASIELAKATSKQHMLAYVDLDQFKIVNNTSGHTAGDELLKLVGRRIAQAMAAHGAKVARLGGDEFGVLVDDVSTERARELAEEILNVVRDQRFDWEGRHYALSASLGLVFVDEGTENADAAMRAADESCYAAKDAGRNRVKEFELGDARMMRRRGVMEWVTQLDAAMDDDRLILNCQRIVPIGNGAGGTASIANAKGTKSPAHYEILLTMADELGDPMPPSEFILAAETYNRVTLVDRWVVENVLRWMADHRGQLDELGAFSINVSGHSINDETFADFVLEQFSRTQAPTSKVCFEITETAAIANLDNARDFMNRMKIIGCRFALDDFGTGLSSYSYLRNLPVDYVKIDGVFVKDMDSSPDDYAVVRSINDIGHYLGKKTIAEYVENQKIFDQLREIGVDYAQGYGIEKPQRLSDLRIA
jgi:diguanylate cyclase (GGDEF)-like protein